MLSTSSCKTCSILHKRDQLSFEAPQFHYRKGDKVIHLVNDAEINVFNGDLGLYTDLIPGKYTESKQDEIVIDFDGNEVSYPRNEWYQDSAWPMP